VLASGPKLLASSEPKPEHSNGAVRRSAEDRYRNDSAHGLRASKVRRVLVQRKMVGTRLLETSMRMIGD